MLDWVDICSAALPANLAVSAGHKGADAAGVCQQGMTELNVTCSADVVMLCTSSLAGNVHTAAGTSQAMHYSQQAIQCSISYMRNQQCGMQVSFLSM